MSFISNSTQDAAVRFDVAASQSAPASSIRTAILTVQQSATDSSARSALNQEPPPQVETSKKFSAFEIIGDFSQGLPDGIIRLRFDDCTTLDCICEQGVIFGYSVFQYRDGTSRNNDSLDGISIVESESEIVNIKDSFDPRRYFL